MISEIFQKSQKSWARKIFPSKDELEVYRPTPPPWTPKAESMKKKFKRVFPYVSQ